MKIQDFYDEGYRTSLNNLVLWRTTDNLSKLEIETETFATKNEFVCKYDLYINLGAVDRANYEVIYHGYFDSHSGTLISDALNARGGNQEATKFFDKWIFPEINEHISERDFIKGIFNIVQEQK